MLSGGSAWINTLRGFSGCSRVRKDFSFPAHSGFPEMAEMRFVTAVVREGPRISPLVTHQTGEYFSVKVQR